MNIRSFISKWIFEVDEVMHRLHISSHNLCLGADVTVGWGPSAEDWERSKTPFLEWFYKWYWQDQCPTCFGTGERWVSPNIFIKRQNVGISFIDHFKREQCPSCRGTGREDALSACLRERNAGR